jgi:hypothetical protein
MVMVTAMVLHNQLMHRRSAGGSWQPQQSEDTAPAMVLHNQLEILK